MAEPGTIPPASGQEGPLASPSDKGNTSALVSPASNSTLPWCYVVNVNGTDSTKSISSPPGVPSPGVSLTNASLPSTRLGQTNVTNTTTVLFNSTILCAEPPATTSGFSLRANLQALDISETTNTSTISTTSSPLPISPSSSRVLVTSSTPISTTTSPESSPTASGVPTSSSVVSPVTPAVPSSATITVSNSPSSVTPSPPASVTESSTSLGVPVSTVTAIPESTFSTPVSITTTDNHATITIPPLGTTTGLSTSPGGSVTVTSVIASPPNQDVSGSSKDSFFENRAAVIGVFLASGFAFAGLVLLAFCCLRRRQRRARRRGSQLLEISYPRPIRNTFADVTGNPTTSERAGPNIRWHRSILPRDPASIPQSLFSVPHNRSEDSLILAHSAPVPPSPAQRAPSRSSYRVPVSYAGIGVHDDTWVENRRSTGAASEHLQIQSTPSSNGPPLLPMRSPLRPLAVHNIARTREKTLSLSLSRASSPSVYPPSPHRSDAGSLYQEEVVASLPPKHESPRWLTRGLSYVIKPGEGQNVDRVDENAESQGARINPDDSRGTLSLNMSMSSSSHVHYSPLESPVSESGTAHTSIQDVNSPNRKVAVPLAPPAPLFMHRKSGARPRHDS